LDNRQIRLFTSTDPGTRWLIRWDVFSLAISHGSRHAQQQQEDFYFDHPLVRLLKNKARTCLFWIQRDIDGRIADLIEGNFLEGIIVVSLRLQELHGS